MPFKKSYLLVSVLLLFFSQAGWGAEIVPKGTGRELPNFHQVNASYYRGGQPSSSGLEQLAQMGIKTIIDLRHGGERAQQEEKLAAKLGMRYVHIPMSNWKAPSSDQVTQFLELVRNPASGPVFVHCRRGADRTGVMSALYRMTHDGWSADQAFEEMRHLGSRPWYYWLKNTLQIYAPQHMTDRPTAHSPSLPNRGKAAHSGTE